MISSLRGILAKSCPHLTMKIEFGGCFCPSGAGCESNKQHHHTAWSCCRSSLHGPPAAPWLLTGAFGHLEEAEMWELQRCGTISEQWSQAGLTSSSSTAFLVCTAQSRTCSVGLVPEKTKPFHSFAGVQWTAVAARMTRRGSAYHGHNPLEQG